MKLPRLRPRSRRSTPPRTPRTAETANAPRPPSVTEVGAEVAEAPSDAEVKATRLANDLRASGLFDEAFYVAQLSGGLPEGMDPVEHYVATGQSTSISPQPCFLPQWYLTRPETPKDLGTDAFIHYVRRGSTRSVSPHPFLDAVAYLADHPDAVRHRGGVLGHYLEHGWRVGAPTAPDVDPAVLARAADPTGEPEAPLASFGRAVRTLLDDTIGHEHLPRTAPTFDHAGADVFVGETLRAYAALGETAPLVSVVIPTKDRAEGVLAAVRSVVEQTYPHWQLVVVDDGSVDDTLARLAPCLQDPRIEVVRREVAGGVSAARNAGLRIARGDYVAYLDSDNTWERDFLEVMVAFVRTGQHRFAYAVSELREPVARGRSGYRSLPFNRAALRERNFIDCIVVLHERELLAEVGGFDEGLRRNVDWDLFIRMAAVTDFGFAPFVATTYDPWEDQADRITVNEPFGYRHVVLGKHVVGWDTAIAQVSERAAGSVSVVITTTGAPPTLRPTLERVLEQTGDEVEVLVIDAKLDDATASVLQYLQLAHPRLRVVRDRRLLSTEVARNLGATLARGETLVFAPCDVWVEPGWLEPLVTVVADGAVAAQPLTLLADGTVWSAGVAHTRGANAHHLFRTFAGDAPEVVTAGCRGALSGRVIAVRAADFLGVRGFEPLFVNEHDSPDLSLRLAHATGRDLAYAPASVVSLQDRPARPRSTALMATATMSEHLYTERWRDRVAADDVEAWSDAGFVVQGYGTKAATHLGFDPVVIRDRAARPLRWAIKIGAPTVARRTHWGDWHFALALKSALERQGHEAVVDCKPAWQRPTARLEDVTLTLRGVSAYAPSPQHLNLLWVISHPDGVTKRELAAFDAVFAASPTLADRMTQDLRRPVPLMLQCTDQHRFAPVAPDTRRRHEVLFVGNARGVRPSVEAALAAGIVPAVYGVRWRGLLPDGAWQGEYVPNEDLPAVYAAAGAVLNDHWPEMRHHGLLSNRLFDLAACGARVISDPVAGMTDVFGDTVLTYETPRELADAVQTHLHESPERRAHRAEVSQRVRRDHSFDARARQLIETVSRLRATRDQPVAIG